MKTADTKAPLHNGAAAAALLSAGIGIGALGVLALAADAWEPLAHLLNVYNPTGDLSGVSSLAILIWLASWKALAMRWSGRDIRIGRVSAAALILLVIGLAFTFPPIMDLIQGR